METEAWSSTVTDKIQELCQSVLDGTWFQSVRERMEAFQLDEEAQARMQAVNEKGQFLQHKQSQGITITPAEMLEFEELREKFFENTVATSFAEAQQEMHNMKEKVMRHLSLTLELGRLPAPEDLQEGGCGSGCGCGHGH